MPLIHTHDEFDSLAALQKNHTCPPCEDVSGVALLRPSQIQHYVYGGCQGTLEIQECLDGIFKVLQLDPSISLLQQHELDQIIFPGDAPTRWTRSEHFPHLGRPPTRLSPHALGLGTTAQGTSSHSICAWTIRRFSTIYKIACLSLPACNSSSIELFGNPSPPATSPFLFSRHIGHFPGLRSKGMLLCSCGHAARSQCQPPSIYSLVDYFHIRSRSNT